MNGWTGPIEADDHYWRSEGGGSIQVRGDSRLSVSDVTVATPRHTIPHTCCPSLQIIQLLIQRCNAGMGRGRWLVCRSMTTILPHTVAKPLLASTYIRCSGGSLCTATDDSLATSLIEYNGRDVAPNGGGALALGRGDPRDPLGDMVLSPWAILVSVSCSVGRE